MNVSWTSTQKKRKDERNRDERSRTGQVVLIVKRYTESGQKVDYSEV